MLNKKIELSNQHKTQLKQKSPNSKFSYTSPQKPKSLKQQSITSNRKNEQQKIHQSNSEQQSNQSNTQQYSNQAQQRQDLTVNKIKLIEDSEDQSLDEIQKRINKLEKDIEDNLNNFKQKQQSQQKEKEQFRIKKYEPQKQNKKLKKKIDVITQYKIQDDKPIVNQSSGAKQKKIKKSLQKQQLKQDEQEIINNTIYYEIKRLQEQAQTLKDQNQALKLKLKIKMNRAKRKSKNPQNNSHSKVIRTEKLLQLLKYIKKCERNIHRDIKLSIIGVHQLYSKISKVKGQKYK